MSNNNKVQPKIPGIHTVADPVYIPAETAPLSRRLYEIAKAPFNLSAAVVSRVAYWILGTWLGALAIAVFLVFALTLIQLAQGVMPTSAGLWTEVQDFALAATGATPILLIFTFQTLFRR